MAMKLRCDSSAALVRPVVPDENWMTAGSVWWITGGGAAPVLWVFLREVKWGESRRMMGVC